MSPLTATERATTEQQLRDLAVHGRDARATYEALHEKFMKQKAAHEAANARCALAHAALSDHVAAPLDAENFPTEKEQAAWQGARDELQRKLSAAIEDRNLLAANLETVRFAAVKAGQDLEHAMWQQRALQIRLHPAGTGVASIG
jgi:hypothetical protein